MSLPERIPLQKRKVVKKSIGGTIGLLFVGGLLSALFAGFFYAGEADLPPMLLALRPTLLIVLLVFFGLLLCWNPVYQYFYWKRYFYDMDEKNIVIRKGVIAQKEITLPFTRITDVYVDQDVFDVLFRLYDVHMSTPTEQSGLFAHIDGVDKEGSVELRRMILERINKEESSPGKALA